MSSLGANSFERLDLPRSFISLREEAFKDPCEWDEAFQAEQAETGCPIIWNHPYRNDIPDEYAHQFALVAGYHVKIYSVINSKSDFSSSEVRQITKDGVELQYSAHRVTDKRSAGGGHGPVVWMSQEATTWIVARYSHVHTINKRWFKYQTRKKGNVYFCELRSLEENSEFYGGKIQMLLSKNLDPLHVIGLPIGSR